MSYLLLFLVSLFSGSLVFIPSLSASRSIKSILSFSGSFLLSICFLHILPELFHESHHNPEELGAYLMLGFFLQLTLDYFSGGIEHGHTHIHQKSIGHFPFLVFISLCLHAFLESMPVEHVSADLHDHSSFLLLGLLVHKAPISFILATLLSAYKLSKWAILIGILIFSLSAPLGVLTGNSQLIDTDTLHKLLSISAGIILHLSTTILLEGNEQHQIKWKKLAPMLIGAGLALLTMI